MTVSTDFKDRIIPHPVPLHTPAPGPRRVTLLHAALSSGLCLDVMIERMLDRNEERL
ncbi:hypothetical protein [Roseovarius rhodophyticola]|uniref:Uncharacterized protein n=1 Tax=Roseovarius rhodophyticola TaxID=3080827 RepID=A0ABZ2TMD5_9RHOB|nr:hypothetical protein [Roseovarius sp. W115]MDV2929227.1 hypothetical protein [Roseovarius sp. W115]